jgi:hypothetical protein
MHTRKALAKCAVEVAARRVHLIVQVRPGSQLRPRPGEKSYEVRLESACQTTPLTVATTTEKRSHDEPTQ